MKRLLVLLTVIALLASVTTAVLADPIHVGGTSFATSAFTPIHVGGTSLTAVANKLPAHAKAYGLRNRLDQPEMLLFSPIHVGGT